MKTPQLYNSHCRVVYSLTSTLLVLKTEEKVQINTTRGGRKGGGGTLWTTFSKAFLALFHVAWSLLAFLDCVTFMLLEKVCCSWRRLTWISTDLKSCFYSGPMNTQMVQTRLSSFFWFFSPLCCHLSFPETHKDWEISLSVTLHLFAVNSWPMSLFSTGATSSWRRCSFWIGGVVSCVWVFSLAYIWLYSISNNQQCLWVLYRSPEPDPPFNRKKPGAGPDSEGILLLMDRCGKEEEEEGDSR